MTTEAGKTLVAIVVFTCLQVFEENESVSSNTICCEFGVKQQPRKALSRVRSVFLDLHGADTIRLNKVTRVCMLAPHHMPDFRTASQVTLHCRQSPAPNPPAAIGSTHFALTFLLHFLLLWKRIRVYMSCAFGSLCESIVQAARWS